MKPKTRLLPYYIILLIAGLGGMYYLRTKMQVPQTSPVSIRDYLEIAQDGVLRLQAAYSAMEHQADATQEFGEIQRLSRALSEASGLKVEVVLENSRDKALKMLLDGQVDVLTRSFVRTSELDSTRLRLVQERLSGPLYLVQRRDSVAAIRKQIDLAGKMITLPAGSRWGIFVEHLAEEIGDSIRISQDPLYDTEQLIVQLAAGTIDYTLCTADEAKSYAEHFADLDFSLPVSYSLRSAWVIRRASTALADSLVVWLERIAAKK